MDWLILIAVVVGYWTIGIKRMPTYFHRVDEHNRKEYPYSYKNTGMPKEAAWGAIGLASIWPFYEGGRWVQNHIINTATAEQRKQQEYAKAKKIIAEYTQRKEREEREAFDRELYEN